MLRGLWKLTWLEIKIFVREPLGVVGTIGIPVVVFAVLSRLAGRVGAAGVEGRPAMDVALPVLGALLIALNAVLSLVTIIAIYREGGILKRLRATPLRPHVILLAHVIVKLLLTLVTLALAVLVGARYGTAVQANVPVVAFVAALVFVTTCILSIGFLIASIVPTARFAQPIGSLLLYPMVALSGLFIPTASLPRPLEMLAQLLPLTYAVSLLQGIWKGEAWTAHGGDVTALVIVFAVCTALSTRVFRWE
jgi:ABC-2 type transport system permease protein